MPDNDQTIPDYSAINTTTTIYNTAVSAVSNAKDIDKLNFSGQEKGIIKYITKGQTAAISLLVSFVQEGDKVKAIATTAAGIVVGEVTGLTIGAALTYLAAGVVATASAPVAIGIGVGIAITSAVVGSVVAVNSSDSIKQIYDYGKTMWDEFFGKNKNSKIDMDNNGTTISTDSTEDFNQALKYINHIASKESKVELFGDTTLREYLKIDSTNNTATVDANTQEAKTTIIKDVLYTKTNLVDKIIHDGQTYDIITANTLTPLELRNLIDNIGEESYYDPAISIREETKMDLGEYGVIDMLYNSGGLYGDLYGRHFNTFEDIFTYTGMTMIDLLKLNPWLFDEDNDGNYVSDYQAYDPTINTFGKPAKLLLLEGTELTTTNTHTIIGDEADDFIKDANGGDDTLIGNGGNDIIIGGSDLGFVSFEGSYLDEREVA